MKTKIISSRPRDAKEAHVGPGDFYGDHNGSIEVHLSSTLLSQITATFAVSVLVDQHFRINIYAEKIANNIEPTRHY